ncbi:hypothetical protein B0H14DRAFT_2713493 [Mycena olivaceomarginata]|nr:hypothetical protein B0H14DRAFT_2713493 [Mycena olivaceomarginata]
MQTTSVSPRCDSGRRSLGFHGMPVFTPESVSSTWPKASIQTARTSPGILGIRCYSVNCLLRQTFHLNISMITIVMAPPRKTIQAHLSQSPQNIVESTSVGDDTWTELPLNTLFDRRISAEVSNASPGQSSGNSALAPEMLVAGAFKFWLGVQWALITFLPFSALYAQRV